MTERPAGPVHRRVPEGDDRERLVCDDCGFVWYQNPIIVVGTVPIWNDRVALVKRSIEPRRGFWTIPAGFMELGETVEDGAIRETREEAEAEVELDGLLAVYNIIRVKQVHIFYRARLLAPEVRAGQECSDARLFAWDEIPWNDIAFPSTMWALEHAAESRGGPIGQPFTNTVEPPSLEEFAATNKTGPLPIVDKLK
jgi:ADP-ribose pyrophosphatase YjhB (NUDIX family)